MLEGSITFDDYIKFFEKKVISSKYYNKKQIQPSSIDLTLSDECFEVSSSFLSNNDKVKNKLRNFTKKKN